MKSIPFLYLLFFLLLLLDNPAHAEGGCPPGMVPEGGAGVSACRPISGYNSSQAGQQAPRPLPPEWESRWGAIAMDESPEHGSTGASVNQSTRTAAAQEAMENCQSNGGVSCKITIAYNNECVAIVMGNPGGYTVNDITQEKATQAAMNECRNHGNTNSHIYYTSCSLPVRIQ